MLAFDEPIETAKLLHERKGLLDTRLMVVRRGCDHRCREYEGKDASHLE